MVKNNLIPLVEYKKPVEEVYEIKDEVINSFEERRNLIVNKSKLSPAARNKVIKKHGSDYLSERTFNNDIALMQMYGSGFWDDIKHVVKPIARGALVVASVLPPAAPIALPISAGIAVTGMATAGIGHLADNKDFKEVEMDLVEIGGNACIEGNELKQGGAEAVVRHYTRRN